MSEAQAALQRIHAAALAAVQRGVNPGILEGCARVLEAAAWGAAPTAPGAAPTASASSGVGTTPPATGDAKKAKRSIKWKNATHHAAAIIPRLLGRKINMEKIVQTVRDIFREDGEPEPSDEAAEKMIALIAEQRAEVHREAGRKASITKRKQKAQKGAADSSKT